MNFKSFITLFGVTSTLCFGNQVPFRAIGEVFDFGPQVKEIVLNFDEPLNTKSIDKDTFKVIAVSSNSVPRKITDIKFPNDKTVVLELEFGQNIKGAEILRWDEKLFSNIEIPIDYSIVQTKAIETKDGKPLSIENQKYKISDLEVEGVEKFSSGEMFGLKYRDFKPKLDRKKHPLIIWLHGAGEGGESNATQILGNRGGVAFVEEESQKIFDNPYVLAPQTPTFWMKSFMVGDRELIGEKDYTPDLINLIKKYLDENPSIDRDRIYIGGCSMGGYQTFKTLVADPNIFAGAFITCPAYEPSKEELEKVKDVPIWLVHASSDTTVPVSNSRNSFKYLKSLGADVVYTEYEEVVRDGNKYDPHGSYFYTLHNDPFSGDGTHIFQWIASKKLKNK